MIDISSSLSSTASELTTQVTSAVGTALPFAGGLLGVFVVWRVFKSLVKR